MPDIHMSLHAPDQVQVDTPFDILVRLTSAGQSCFGAQVMIDADVSPMEIVKHGGVTTAGMFTTATRSFIPDGNILTYGFALGGLGIVDGEMDLISLRCTASELGVLPIQFGSWGDFGSGTAVFGHDVPNQDVTGTLTGTSIEVVEELDGHPLDLNRSGTFDKEDLELFLYGSNFGRPLDMPIAMAIMHIVNNLGQTTTQ